MKSTRSLIHLPSFAVLVVALTALSGCIGEGTRDPWFGMTHAEAILLDAPDTLLVEIDHAEGFPPHPLALDALREVLEELTLKKQIIILEPQSFPIEQDTYDESDLWAKHLATFDHQSTPWNVHEDRATLHILYVNGEHPTRPGVGGFYNGAAVLYIERIYLASDALPSEFEPGGPERERAVLIHEVGHAMGLVDRELPMQTARLHPDDDCRCHSNNPDSAMYAGFPELTEHPTNYVTEWTNAAWQFDADDIADIRAFQAANAGKYPR